MNKRYIPGVIIVEGKHDAAKLANIYDSIYVITNGYEFPEEEKDFVLNLKPDIQIIVLTDNDEAGEVIRNNINELKTNLINIRISAPKNSKKGGVNECSISDIKNALDKYSLEIKNEEYYFYEFERLSSAQVEELSKEFHLGKCSKKSRIKRIELLDLKEEILKRI